MNDRLVWIDCEMTGLDLELDALVEIAVLVTDAELTVLDEGLDIVIRPPDEAVERMSGQWAEVCDELRGACDQLGDSAGATAVSSAYAETLAAADEVTTALARALSSGVAALIDAARDVSEADETVALEIGRAAGGHGLHLGQGVGLDAAIVAGRNLRRQELASRGVDAFADDDERLVVADDGLHAGA